MARFSAFCTLFHLSLTFFFDRRCPLTRQAGCVNATWFSENIRSVVQIFRNILYCISLILLELLSNYILIKLWQKINCPEIAKQNVAALASIRNLRNGIIGFLTTTWFSSKTSRLKIKPGNFLRYCVLMISEHCQIIFW